MIKELIKIKIIYFLITLLFIGCVKHGDKNVNIKAEELLKNHESAVIFSDFNLFKMDGIDPFKSVKEITFPFVVVEEKVDSKLLFCHINNSISYEYLFKWDGHYYYFSEKYQDDDGSNWLKYIIITRNSIFKANFFIDENTSDLFLSDLVECSENKKNQYFFSEKKIKIKDKSQIINLDLKENAILIKEINYHYIDVKNELLIKEVILQNLIDNDNKSICQVLNLQSYSFLWDIFINRQRGILIRKKNC